MILGKKYEGPEVDMWSLGVILFALLCGHLPFDDENIQKLYAKIASGVYVCPDHVQPSAKHLIERLITVDPKERIKLKEVLSHQWVMEAYESVPPNYIPDRVNIKSVNDLSPDLVRRLYAFGYKDVDISQAFNETSDMSQPNAVRSTYHLLREMLCREEIKQQRLLKLRKGGVKESSDERISPVRRQSYQASQEIERMSQDVDRKMSISDDTRQATHQARLNIQPRGRSDEASIGPPLQPKHHDKIDSMDIDTPKSIDSELQNSAYRLSNPVSVSQNSIGNGKRRSSASRIREDLKVVSTWFMNISTTTTKSIPEIHGEIRRVSANLGITVNVESDSLLNCDVDFSQFVDEDNQIGSSVERDAGSNKVGRVSYQIEICKVGRSEQQLALNFKRTNGGVWNFKKVSNRVIALMVL